MNAIPPPDFFAKNPWRRISATQVALYRRCPAQWACRYVDWHQEPRPAVMFAGVAIQQAVEDVLRMSLPDEWNPRDTVGDAETSLDGWATARATEAFVVRWNEQQEAFRASPGVVGEWDLPESRFLAYAVRGVRMHVGIVMARWKFQDTTSLKEAWEAARPEMPGNDLRVIPEGWYQWAADLIYTMPDGERVMVDMKVGRGGDWVPKYEEQMRSYLWADDHSRPGETPARGALWLLGADTIVHEVDRWHDDEYRRFRITCDAMLCVAEMRESNPMAAAAMLTHAGTQKDCQRCPYAVACPSPSVPKASLPEMVHAAGHAFDRIDGAGTGHRITFRARVLGIGDPKEKNGKRTCRVTLANGSGMRSYSWDAHHVERLGLRVGQVVSLSGLRTWAPPGGRATMLFADQYTEAHS